jgi:predicted methyltransferase MtxX (methanogen marker protein 4)
MPESGTDEPSQGRCVGVAAKGGQPYAKWKRSRRCGAFVGMVGQGRARNLGCQEDIDRLISRAEEADGSCLEERSFQQALEGPDETT